MKTRTTKTIRKNGKTLRDRVCPECGREHFHGENMCIACRNAQQKNRKEKLPDVECQKEKLRKVRVAQTAARIKFEISQIEKAGLDHRNSTIEKIYDKGVTLRE